MKKDGILKNTFIVGAFTALSRVLGLVREMLQARFIGAGVEQSAFTLAFALPNMMRKLFGEGALTAAFVPIFREEIEKGSLEKANKLARAVLTTVMLMLLAVVAISIGTLDLFVHFRSCFLIADESRFLLTVKIVKILVPYMLFICGAAFGMGVLNTLGKFKASGFVPCLLNIVWISTLAFIGFHNAFSEAQFSVADRVVRVSYAILFAGALQMVVMFWMMAKSGVIALPTFKGWSDSAVVKVWKNLGIAAMGAGAIQINYMLDQVLAQLASPWAAGVIGYAERLMDLPLGIIGVAFGTVLLPTFSTLFAKGDEEGVKNALSSSIRSLMFIMLPAAAGLCVLAPEITRVIYEGGDFDKMATIRVSRALAVYSLGLALFGYQKSIIPWFQAQSDMKTPLRVSLITVVLNAILNILAVALLPCEFRHVGLAVSTVLCAGVGAILLTIFAMKKNGDLGLASSINPITRMIFASLIMGGVLIFAKPFFANMNSILTVGILIFIGMISYGLLALWLFPSAIKKVLKRRGIR